MMVVAMFPRKKGGGILAAGPLGFVVHGVLHVLHLLRPPDGLTEHAVSQVDVSVRLFQLLLVMYNFFFYLRRRNKATVVHLF